MPKRNAKRMKAKGWAIVQKRSRGGYIWAFERTRRGCIEAFTFGTDYPWRGGWDKTHVPVRVTLTYTLPRPK